MTATSFHCELAWVVQDGGSVPAAAENVRIAVEDGRIVEVATGVVADAGDRRLSGFTVPGLANVHSHAFHRALRGRTHSGEGSFWSWRDLMYRVAGRLDPDSYHDLARAVFGEMAMAGITAVGEFHYVHHPPDGGRYADPNAMGEALVVAAAEAGLRITLLDTLYLHGGLDGDGYRPLDGWQRRFSDGSADAWIERLTSFRPPPHARVGGAVHSVRAVDPEAMATAADWADSTGSLLHAHVSEQPLENERCREVHGGSPVAVLEMAGLLGPRFTAVHATHLAEADVGSLAGSGSGVCLCPTTERDLGDGIGPSRQLAAAGVALSLGTDSHAMIDLLDEARAVELDQRLLLGQRGIHPSAALLTAATADGQQALGWTDGGALAVGCRADLVSIALDSVRTSGADVHNAVDMVVFAASAADVHHVVVDGRVVVEGHRHRQLDVAAELASSLQAVVGDG